MPTNPQSDPKPPERPRALPSSVPTIEARALPRRSPRLRRVRAWLRKGHDPLAGLYLTIPVFLLYHLGILTVRSRNGADMVSQAMFRLLDYSTFAYVVVTLGIAVGVAIAVRILRKTSRLRVSDWLPMLAESIVLAIVVPLVAAWTTVHLVDLQLGLGSMGAFEKLVMAAGAGFHEELLFRVIIFGGLVLLLTKVGRASVARALIASAVISAIAFSSVHYIGAFGDDFMLASFLFRMLAGILLAAVYWWRGFAVVVYTHMFYDVFVLFLR